MDRVPPEIWHVLCTFLTVDELLNFRLVNKAFADIGAAYMLPEVTFYMHHEELDRLHEISLHPIFSKNVYSLTYFAQALDCPKVSLQEFLRDHKKDLRWDSKLRERNLNTQQLMTEYRKYEDAVERQTTIMNAKLDIAILKEVLPRFPSLRSITMSASNAFYEEKWQTQREKPLSKIMRGNRMYSVHPEGSRPLEALLVANAKAKCDLISSLRAGELHWKFFRKSPAELSRMFRPLANLTEIELLISMESADSGVREYNATERCRKVMGKGPLRNVLKSMPHLQYLCVEINAMECEDLIKPATLRDLIEPGFRWASLEELIIGGVETDRQELMRVLTTHKDTLKRLCLRDIDLKTTSWRKLLPDIRSKMDLEDACICGEITGHAEDGEEHPDPLPEWLGDNFGPEYEFWDLSVPEFSQQDMRDSINVYCREGGRRYPDELPLTDEVVEKYFEEYVQTLFEWDDDEEWEDDEDKRDSLLSSEDGWEDVGSSDDDASLDDADDPEGGDGGDDDDDGDDGSSGGDLDGGAGDIDMEDDSLDDAELEGVLAATSALITTGYIEDDDSDMSSA
ncbi:hypothetical protein GGR56DRAFT_456045 [Xylariaceae sp. FL0804]|nr:hypothetical protein GGR56DRAFT_456045 [Xylariaceae sp. FL0804]